MTGYAIEYFPVQRMSSYFSRYCTLLSSEEQLAHCRHADSLGNLLTRIKLLWNCVDLNDNELLSEVNRLNQMPVDGIASLAGNWLPYFYQPKRQRVNWLLPVGHATEPFQDEYISRCRQQLLNQIIQPCSSLEFTKQQAENVPNVQPSGFIFHLSRCGSTLISGCLSEFETTCVFSESPLLTELLLDNRLSDIEHKNYLRALINLQAAAFPERPQVIIKWNAWDIFYWSLIREIYRRVPTIFLVRDPVEILASHQRSAGRHMAGDISLTAVNPIFLSTGQPLLVWRSGVLGALLDEMKQFAPDPLVSRIDYSYLDASQIQQICHHFCVFDKDVFAQKITRRLQFHSKTPEVIFSDDRPAKQTLFTAEEALGIRQQLLPIYLNFLNSEI